MKKFSSLMMALVVAVLFTSAAMPDGSAPSQAGEAGVVQNTIVDQNNVAPMEAAAWVRAAVWLSKEAVRAAGRGARLLSITYLSADGTHSDVVDVPVEVKLRELDQ